MNSSIHQLCHLPEASKEPQSDNPFYMDKSELNSKFGRYSKKDLATLDEVLRDQSHSIQEAIDLTPVLLNGWYWTGHPTRQERLNLKGKYLFFSPSRKVLSRIAWKEMQRYHIKLAKISAVPVGGEHVLCLYHQDDSLKLKLAKSSYYEHGLEAYGSLYCQKRNLEPFPGPFRGKYRWWKSNEATDAGIYSAGFLTKLSQVGADACDPEETAKILERMRLSDLRSNQSKPDNIPAEAKCELIVDVAGRSLKAVTKDSSVQPISNQIIPKQTLPPPGFKSLLPTGTIYAAIGPHEKIFYIGWTSRDLQTRQKEHLSRCQNWLGYVWEAGTPKPFAMLLHMLRRNGTAHLIHFEELCQGTKRDECKLIQEKWLEGHPILNLGIPCHELQEPCGHGADCTKASVNQLGCQGTILKGLAHVKHRLEPYIVRWGLIDDKSMLFTVQTALEPMLVRTFRFEPSLWNSTVPSKSPWNQWIAKTNWLERTSWNRTRQPREYNHDMARYVIELYQQDGTHYGYAHVYVEILDDHTVGVCSFEDLAGIAYPPPEFPLNDDLEMCLTPRYDEPLDEIRNHFWEVPSSHLDAVLQQLSFETPLKLTTIERVDEHKWNIKNHGGVGTSGIGWRQIEKG